MAAAAARRKEEEKKLNNNTERTGNNKLQTAQTFPDEPRLQLSTPQANVQNTTQGRGNTSPSSPASSSPSQPPSRGLIRTQYICTFIHVAGLSNNITLYIYRLLAIQRRQEAKYGRAVNPPRHVLPHSTRPVPLLRLPSRWYVIFFL